MKITMIRHTSVNVEPGVCYGRTDVPVRPTFPEEASATRENIRRLLEETGVGFEAVYRSPLTRCRLLAEACGFPHAVPDGRIIEMDFGEWEMCRYDAIRDPRLQQWYDDWLNTATTDGESFLDQQRRVADFLDEMKRRHSGHLLAFTHAGVIMNAMLLAGLADLGSIFSSQPRYGSLTTIEI